MTTHVGAVTFDCSNAKELADFWSGVLELPVDGSRQPPNEFFARILPSEERPGPALMFIKVPEGKEVKNRVHLDLDSEDRESDVERLVGLGATVVHDKDEWGMRWTTLTDPEGNEFCIGQH